jgi:hypothetical protein
MGNITSNTPDADDGVQHNNRRNDNNSDSTSTSTSTGTSSSTNGHSLSKHHDQLPHHGIHQYRRVNPFVMTFQHNLDLLNRLPIIDNPIYIQTLDLWVKGILVVPPLDGYRPLKDGNNNDIDIFHFNTTGHVPLNVPHIRQYQHQHQHQHLNNHNNVNVNAMTMTAAQIHQLSLMELATAEQRDCMLDCIVMDSLTIHHILTLLKHHTDAISSKDATNTHSTSIQHHIDIIHKCVTIFQLLLTPSIQSSASALTAFGIMQSRYQLLCSYNLVYPLVDIQRQLQYIQAQPLSLYSSDKHLKHAMESLSNIVRLIDERPQRREIRLMFCRGLYQVDYTARHFEKQWEKHGNDSKKHNQQFCDDMKKLILNEKEGNNSSSGDYTGHGNRSSENSLRQRCALTEFAADPLYDKRLVKLIFTYLFPHDPIDQINEE